jgi:hypothetical protein
MKTTLSFALIVVLLILSVPSSSQSGVKEVKGLSIRRLIKPGSDGEFQLRIRFTVPDLPENAHVDHAYFIVDQKFEMPVITDTLWLRLGRDTMEVPVGLRTNGKSPILFSLICLDENRQRRYPNWIGTRQMEEQNPIRAFLIPTERIQLERKEGRWKNEALKVAVTDFVKSQASQRGKTLEFVVAGGSGHSEGLRPTQVHLVIQNISARLLIFYTEPLVYPPGFK